MRRLTFVVTMAAVVAASSCSSSSGGGSARSDANGLSRATLASGVYPNVAYPAGPYTPETPLYMSIVDFPQPNGEAAPVGGHVHPSGFVYVLTGTTEVNLDDGSKVTVNPGEAIFAPPFIHHHHSNPGPGPDDWLFLGPRTVAVQSKPLPSPSAKLVLNGPDLPPLVPNGNYMMRLDQVTLRPGGQSAVTKQGGPTLLYVLDGQLSLHQQSTSPHPLQSGQSGLEATFLPEGAVFQLHNPDKKSQAQVLIMTMWLQGQLSDKTVSSASF